MFENFRNQKDHGTGKNNGIHKEVESLDENFNMGYAKYRVDDLYDDLAKEQRYEDRISSPIPSQGDNKSKNQDNPGEMRKENVPAAGGNPLIRGRIALVPAQIPGFCQCDNTDLS